MVKPPSGRPVSYGLFAGAGARFLQQPLPEKGNSMERWAGWYRCCLEVRDTNGAERILLIAIRDEVTESNWRTG